MRTGIPHTVIKISTTLRSEMQNLTHTSLPVRVQATRNVQATQPTTVRSGNPTVSHQLLTAQPTAMVHDIIDFQTPFVIAKNTKMAQLFDPKTPKTIKVNHTHTDAILATLKLHAHPEDGKLSSAVMTCTTFIKVKLASASHRRTKHTPSPGTVICTYVAGSMDVTGENVERYMVTFSDIVSR